MVETPQIVEVMDEGALFQRFARRRSEEERADKFYRLRATTNKAASEARNAASGASNPIQLDEPSVGCPAGQLVTIGELQLTQHAADMRLDSLDRDKQLLRDLLVRVAARDQPEHLTLTLGQSVKIFVNRRKIN